MAQRSQLTPQLLLTTDSKPKTSRLWLAISILLITMFVMPSAQAAGCKLPKSYYKNVSCTASKGYFLAIKDFGAPVALIDSSGNRVVDLSRYQKVDANKISGGLMPVLRNSHVGYINMQGREVVPTIYNMLNEAGGKVWARPVSEGRIVVKKGDDYGVISISNETILPFSAAITDIDNYRNGTARVRKNQATSWIDKSGKTTGNPNDGDSTQASANHAATATSSLPSQPRPPSFDHFTTLLPHQQDGKWGFIDEKNVTMITYSFDDVRPFSEGLAGVLVDNKWGFVNLGGELVVPFRFDNSDVTVGDRYKGVSSFVFKDGKAWIGNLQNDNKMCIDKEGTSVACD